jgi:hypothetical protein
VLERVWSRHCIRRIAGHSPEQKEESLPRMASPLDLPFIDTLLQIILIILVMEPNSKPARNVLYRKVVRTVAG